MKVLIACEESQAVTIAFRELGHEAYSLDLLDCSGGFPEWHIKSDVLYHLKQVRTGYYDMIGLHYPCTAVALCGNKHYGIGMPKHNLRIEAIGSTKEVLNLCLEKSDKVYYENPKNVMGRYIGKRSQVIHPYQFGHLEQKETWLWLYGLSPLEETNNVYDEMMKLPKNKRERIFHMTPSEERGSDRSKTFPGIAKAMAEQWGRLKKQPL